VEETAVLPAAWYGPPSGHREAALERDMRDGLYPSGHRDWRLLLQIDTDHRQNLYWQAGGRGYFWIREADLRARNFDGTWLEMQCT
jgi:uncharacterized protein YwqG